MANGNGRGSRQNRAQAQGGLNDPQTSAVIGNPPFARFEFGMTEALVSQLSTFLTKLGWKPLAVENVEASIQVDDRRSVGVYMLGRRMADGTTQVVYIGQSRSTLFSRLTRHARNVQHRSGLDPDHLFFRAAAIVIFNSVDMESGLLNNFKTKWDAADPLSGWNGSGFGSNDTGSGRDEQKPSNFDRRFPIDIMKDLGDRPEQTTETPESAMTAEAAIALLSDATPYTVRVATRAKKHPDLQKPVSAFPAGRRNAHDACKHILAALGPPWVAQVFPVRIVLDRMDNPPDAVADPMNWPNFPENVPYVVITP